MQSTKRGNPDMTETPEDFGAPASEEAIQRVAGKIRERNIEVVIVEKVDLYHKGEP
jgi:hypothetical protein